MKVKRSPIKFNNFSNLCQNKLTGEALDRQQTPKAAKNGQTFLIATPDPLY